MLRTECLEEGTLGLLKSLSNFAINNDFFLVGGTALALQFGHRISIDLDFFTLKSFDTNEIASDLINKAYKFEPIFSKNIGFSGLINGVKVDWIIKNIHY